MARTTRKPKHPMKVQKERQERAMRKIPRIVARRHARREEEYEMEHERRTTVVDAEIVENRLAPKESKEHRTGKRFDHGIGDGINIPPGAVSVAAATGRPSIYDPYRFPHIAYVLCKERGFTNAELARVFDVSVSTVNQWVWLHDEFKFSVRRGRDEYDTENVEQALKKRALGYKFTEKHTTKTKLVGKLANGTEVEVPAISVTLVEKEVAPDPRSIMYWLQNRQPERWKNTLKIEVDANKQPDAGEGELAIEDMSTAELIVLRDMAGKAAELQAKTIDITAPEKRQASVEEILAAADKVAATQGVSATN